MSAEKPEVGDVWKHNKYGTLCHVTEVGENYMDIIGKTDGRYERMYFVNSFSDIGNDKRFSDFLKYHTYINKSKVNINDLFEVRDDQN